MILYKENPDLPYKVCTTVLGDKEYCKNCYSQDHKWFPKDVKVVEIKGKYFLHDKRVEYDHELKQYFIKDYASGIINGVVGYDCETKQLIIGYFTRNSLNNVEVLCATTGNSYKCINPEVLEGSGYVEEIATGIYRKGLGSNKITNVINHANKGYNIEENGYERLIKAYNEKTYKFDINHAKIASLLRGTTFGIELEACAGNLPDYLLNRTGCCICKDGSLRDNNNLYPPEYVTVPLAGAKGIGNIIELCGYLSSRNIVDLKCSYHQHLGGFTTNRQFLVALHSLCYKIQSGVFRMFPAYKLRPEGIKGKNYCKVLPKVFKQYNSGEDYTEYINNSYRLLYTYLSAYPKGGENKKGEQKEGKVAPSQQYNRKNKIHTGGNNKWNRLARYHWMNMINSVFSERNTIEFRLHTPTFNATKIINWLLICNAICKYAERFPLECINGTKIKFDDVLGYYQRVNSSNLYAQYITGYLKAYVVERTEMFKADKKAGDVISDHELQNDKTYTFSYEDKTLF